MFLDAIDYNKKIEKQIANIISEFFHENLFKGMFEIINISNRVYNAKTTLLQEAIINGQIIYQNGAFYSKRNNFSNAVAVELEKIGAKYSKWRKAYVISINKLDAQILWAIQTEQARTDATVKALVEFLSFKALELPKLSEDLVFGEIVNTMFLDLQKRLYDNAKKKKIALITPKLDDFRLQEIHKNYVDNLHFWIKNFSEQETVKMRETLINMVLDGKSVKTIATYIQNRYGVNKRKALFLARNENAIATASYLKAKYTNEGFKYFRWNDSHDERVRTLHRELGAKENNKYGINGTNIFSFDNPPVIYEQKKDGVIVRQDRGLPAETYNCYSKDTEVLTKDGFKLIKDVNIGEIIASINPETKQFEWTTCTNKVNKMVDKITNIQTNIFDLSVSNDHTFFYYKKKYNGKRIIKNSEYPIFTTGVDTLSKKNTIFYATCENWNGNKKATIYNIPVDIFCKFMGYYLSDGNVDKRSKNCIHIAQQNNNAMFNELKPYLHICQGKEKLYIYNEDLYNLVSPLGYANKKRIPDVIKELPSEQIRVFLNAFASCDGRKETVAKGFNDTRIMKTYNQYFTTSPQMMADLVECIYKTNMSCSVYTINSAGKTQQFKNGVYTINNDLFIINEMKTKTRTMEVASITETNYNDFVYDIEVAKNHTILIKKGKSIHWNSNCRCTMSVYIDKELFKRRNEIYKKQERLKV